MNYYIVPAVLYQQQQKLNAKGGNLKTNRRKSRKSSITSETLNTSHRVNNESQEASSLPENEDVTSRKMIASRSSRSSSFASASLKQQSSGSLLRSSMARSVTSRRDSELRNNSSISNLSRKSESHEVDRSQISDQNRLSIDASSTGNSLQHKIHSFNPITDLELLNDEQKIMDHFINPTFMHSRYHSYLEILGAYHPSDLVNFATLRKHSLMKFIQRHLNSGRERRRTISIKDSDDVRYFEGLVAFELMQVRNFLRRFLEQNSKNSMSLSENLLQLNFINYIRYLFTLPETRPDGLDAMEVKHYEFRDFYVTVSRCLHELKKKGYAKELFISDTDAQSLYQTITKVSYEFLLLEQYTLYIFVKLNLGFIIEKRNARLLFDSYITSSKLQKRDSIKLLSFNFYYSHQLSWFMGLSLPFLRVIEANANAVNQKETKNLNPASETFSSLDEQLHETYFKHLQLSNFETLMRMSPKELVELQNTIAKDQNGALDSHLDYKPSNVTYFSSSLNLIASETFDIIQLRDLYLQLTHENFEHILGQFFRTLKKGGVLEIPIFLSGDGVAFADTLSMTSNFPKTNSFMNHDVSKRFKFKSQFTESLLKQLCELFGESNVRFSTVILNDKDETSSYLIKQTAMTVYENCFEMDNFCERYANREDLNLTEDVHVHYYFYFMAQKPL